MNGSDGLGAAFERTDNRTAQCLTAELGLPPHDSGSSTTTIDVFAGALSDGGKGTRLFAPFIYIDDHFTKTGSGQT
jgi:hypothetical protein